MPRALVVVSLLLAGCANERTRAPDVATPQRPGPPREVVVAKADVAFDAPHNWRRLTPVGSLAGGVRSSSAAIAVWRYRRSEPLPATREETRRVRDLLVDRVKVRDPTFELVKAQVGRRRIELLGRGTIEGTPVGLRSLHLFARGEEVVLDAYAPRRHFERLDRTVFAPALDSVRRR